MDHDSVIAGVGKADPDICSTAPGSFITAPSLTPLKMSGILLMT